MNLPSPFLSERRLADAFEEGELGDELRLVVVDIVALSVVAFLVIVAVTGETDVGLVEVARRYLVLLSVISLGVVMCNVAIVAYRAARRRVFGRGSPEERVLGDAWEPLDVEE